MLLGLTGTGWLVPELCRLSYPRSWQEFYCVVQQAGFAHDPQSWYPSVKSASLYREPLWS